MSFSDRLVSMLTPRIFIFPFSEEAASIISLPPLRWIVVRATLKLEIFLDLKLHDIPNTVANSIRKISNFNVALTTIHLNGGKDMIEAASSEKKGNIKILGVSILTSLSKNDILEITDTKFDIYFNNLISIASNTNIDGVVCSPNELDKLKDFKKLKIVPGIRNDISDDDQKRVMSSNEAYQKGADFIVVGRPITKSDDPRKAMEFFL